MKDKLYNTRYKNWIILDYTEKKKADGRKIYKVKCPYCGFEKEAVLHDLYLATSKCGHIYQKVKKWPSYRLQRIYHNMKSRCYNPNDQNFYAYGAKNITIYDQWLQDPNNFINWAMQNGYTDNLTIDRIDSNKNYTPENCRWVTALENSKWKSTTNSYTIGSITDSGRGWARRLGLNINHINAYARQHSKEETLDHINMLLKKCQ